MTIRITTLSGAPLTIDVRPSNLPESDVALTVDVLDDRMTIQLTRDQAEQLRAELRSALRRV